MNKKERWLQLRHYTFEHVVSPGLWDKLTATFGHTEASLIAFAHKIGKKHGWNTRFTLLAINEYKKFVFLGLISDFQVTPSKIIDVVWHEHILFSKAYRDFCEQVIGQPFDHYPELVPMEDQTGRFSAQYLDTIELYKKEFSVDPPAAILGNTKFDQELVKKKGYLSKKKDTGTSDSSAYGDEPLFTHFGSEPAAEFPEFSGFNEGDGGGAGANGDWSDGHGSSDGGDDSGDGDGGGCSGGCGGD